VSEAAGRPGPDPRFDPETAIRRKREQTYRSRLIDRSVNRMLQRRNPRIYSQLRALAEAEVNEQRGTLPGDEPGDSE
jgi:hypothetical protein